MRKLATGLYCITFLVYHPQHGSRGVGSAFSRVLLCVRTTVLALYRQSDWRYFEQTWQVEATLQSWHLHIYWRYIYLISQRKIIRFSWNCVHSSRFWTGWTSRDQKWQNVSAQSFAIYGCFDPCLTKCGIGRGQFMYQGATRPSSSFATIHPRHQPTKQRHSHIASCHISADSTK